MSVGESFGVPVQKEEEWFAGRLRPFKRLGKPLRTARGCSQTRWNLLHSLMMRAVDDAVPLAADGGKHAVCFDEYFMLPVFGTKPVVTVVALSLKIGYERSAKGNSRDLQPPADPKYRQPPVHCGFNSRQLESVTRLVHSAEIAGVRAAIQGGFGIDSAREQQAVGMGEDGFEVDLIRDETDFDIVLQ